jgi:hypothetical protein
MVLIHRKLESNLAFSKKVIVVSVLTETEETPQLLTLTGEK